MVEKNKVVVKKVKSRITKQNYDLSKLSNDDLTAFFNEYKLLGKKKTEANEEFWCKVALAAAKGPKVKYKRPQHLSPLDLKSLEGQWLRMISAMPKQETTLQTLWCKIRAKVRRILMWRKYNRVRNDVRGTAPNPYVSNTTPPKKYMVVRVAKN